MRTCNKIRSVLALVMLMSLMPFFVVKATHVHNHNHISYNNGYAVHVDSSDSDCPICSFILSPAVEDDEPAIEPLNLTFEYVQTNYIDSFSQSLNINYALRAPPVSKF